MKPPHLATKAEKLKAQELARKAIKEGKIEKAPCSVCGSRRSHAHHEDYSQPLVVVFLCARHHLKRHWEIKWGHAELSKERAKEMMVMLKAIGMNAFKDVKFREDFRLICDLAIQKLSEREALRKKAAKRRKMMKRGGGK